MLDVVALYLAMGCVVGGSLWWLTSERAARVQARVAVSVAAVLTMFGLFVPLPERDGEKLIKVSTDVLRGMKQILLMPTGSVDPVFAQAWAVGNLFVLWPLAVVLLVNARWSRTRVLVTCAMFIVACEAVQGGVPGLRRAFELADIVMNVGGVLLLFAVMRALHHSRIAVDN